ncbi:ankyrin-1-like isoform X2 [Gigantopelta aegis]|uniref:ankyrin-1-like isoform X2 n=1 Tax=Gigantopelta aegis TaxID=1735272 RepID=UPI001B889079|nr:ankyrin-1-like isoform X2 [Gigantopelta aegis]
MEPEHLLWEAVRSNDIETMRLLLGCTCGRFDLSSIIGKRTEQGSDLACSADVSPDTLSTVCGCTSVQKSPRFDPTALRLACKVCQLESVKVLLEGMKTHAQMSERTSVDSAASMSPLMYATKGNCNVEMVKLLLEHGWDVTVKDADGNTPLHLATVSGSEPIIRLLVTALNRARATPCTVNVREKSPFHLACKFGHCAILKHLLQHKCSISCDSAAKQDLLHEAAKYSQVNVVRLLLENGLNVNQFDNFAKTALFEAVKADNLEVVEVLLNAHADPNIPSAPYESPILYAAEHSSPQVVEALLREGADVNTTDVVGVTPLIYAAKRCADRKSSKQEDITALLLRYGADMTHKYLHTHTALSIAVACGNIRCAKVLIEAGAEVRETPRSGKLMLLHIVKNRECAELLLKHGVPVDHLNSAHKTALMIACRDNKVDMARLLMEHGADVNKTTLEGISPLFYAVNNDSAVLVKDLIMAGACNVNDHLLIYFRSLLELALFLKASHHVCHLLHLAGAVVRSSFPSFRALYNSSSYLHFINMTVPPELWHCKLWAKFRTRTSFSGYDGLEESFMVHSKMMSLEERCCHMLRKYLNFNKQAMRTLSLPQHVISKLMMEIY